jgi:hypothetical protein
MFVNPLLTELFPWLRVDTPFWYEIFDDLPIAAQHPNASWHGMFFTQPPVRSLVVEYDCKDGDSDEGSGSASSDWSVMAVDKGQHQAGLYIGSLFADVVRYRCVKKLQPSKSITNTSVCRRASDIPPGFWARRCGRTSLALRISTG